MADVKHTPELWYVRPAWTRGRDGNERRCGWHLMSGNAWAQTYARKRDAQAEAARQNALFAATEAAIAKATGSATECTCPAADMPFGRCCKAGSAA